MKGLICLVLKPNHQAPDACQEMRDCYQRGENPEHNNPTQYSLLSGLEFTQEGGV